MFIKKVNNSLIVDELSNSLDSLQKFQIFLKETEKDPSYWKWSMIAFHNALYGSMILALRGSAPTKTVLDKNRSKKIKNGGLDDLFLLSFPRVFKRIQDPNYMKMYVNSRYVCLNPNYDSLNDSKKSEDVRFFPNSVRASIEHLNKHIRNEFMHLFPKHISFGINGFKEVLRDLVPLFEFLFLESGNVILTEDQENNIKNEIKIINKTLSRF